MLNYLTLKSLMHRKFITVLSILSIGISVALSLSISKIKTSAEEGFTNTISQTDFIVGAKGGSLNLLLYSIFHMGTPVNNIRYESYEKISALPSVRWSIPLSLGDSYRGFRVIGTDENFYSHYRFRQEETIVLESGVFPKNVFDVALGFDVAKTLNHKLNDSIILTHGLASQSLYHHEQTPFKVVSILKKTHTPIDKGVFVTLEGIEAIHQGLDDAPQSNAEDNLAHNSDSKKQYPITQITSFLLGLKNRIQILKMRRTIDQFETEPLMAVIPSLELQEMWKNMSYVENAMAVMGIMAIVVSFLSIAVAIMTSLNEKKRELGIFRSLGARPRDLFFLILYETLILVFMGLSFGVFLFYIGLWSLKPILQEEFSLFMEITMLSKSEIQILAYVLLVAPIIGIFPGIKAYTVGKKSLIR